VRPTLASLYPPFQLSFWLRILIEGLKFVPELGWTSEALQEGAKEARMGNGAAATGLLPDGGMHLVFHHVLASDEALDDALKLEGAPEETQREKFLTGAVETRLRMNAPFLSNGRWREAMAMTASTPNGLARQLQADLERADLVWHRAGCKDARGQWYARRLAWAATYKAAELAMLDDKSEDYEDTWQFVERRFSEQHEVKKSLDVLGLTLTSAAATAVNMLGLPRR